MVGDNGNVLVRRPTTEIPNETKCFVCDVITADGAILLMEFLAVNTSLLENIGRLMGDGVLVVVSSQDVVCNACYLLLKYFTKLETDLTILKKVLRYYLKVKYCLENEWDGNPTISRQDIDYITGCSKQVLSAPDQKPPHSSDRTQKLKLRMSGKTHCNKTEEMTESSSDTMSKLDQKDAEQCETLEVHCKQQGHTEDNCLSPVVEVEHGLNVEDFHSETTREKYFQSSTKKNKNDGSKLLDLHVQDHNVILKEGVLNNKCLSKNNVSTVSLQKLKGSLGNVATTLLHSDSDQGFFGDQCTNTSSRSHVAQHPFIKSTSVCSMPRNDIDTINSQENKHISEDGDKSYKFKQIKKQLLNQSIVFSQDITVSDDKMPRKPSTTFDPLSKHIDRLGLNEENSVAGDSAAFQNTGKIENFSKKIFSARKPLNSIKRKSVQVSQSVVRNVEGSTCTENVDTTEQTKYSPFINLQTMSKAQEDACGLPTSENPIKTTENNQIMIHDAENEWVSGVGIGLDDMPHIVLGDEMIVDTSNIEEIAFEETQEISPCIKENNCDKRKSGIAKGESVRTVSSADASIHFSNSLTSVERIVISGNTGKEENANETSQLYSGANSSEKQSGILRNGYNDDDRIILKPSGDNTQTSLFTKENDHQVSSCEKVFECHICNRILTTQSNLKRHLLKHKKCSVGSVTCELCGEELVDRVHLKQHLKVQHQQYVKCAFCDKEFSNMKLCRDHELTHPERATYKCEICNQMFITEGRLKNHKEIIHDDLCDTFRENKIYKCHICFKTLRTLHNLKRHLTNHDKSPMSVSCNICQEVFTEKSKLHQHREEKHPKKHNCAVCNKEFWSLRSCKIHESWHSERMVYRCDMCETIFLTESRLNRHKETYHREPFCRICDKEITDRSKLIEHERRHGRFKQVFMCKECPKVFRTASGLKYHMSVHTGKYAVYCEICGKGLHSEVVLAEHKASHTKEVRYTCELCGRTFSSNSTYRMHRLWHDNPLPYKCNFCDKKFKHTSILAVHKRRIHTGERPYKCKYCNMAFSVSSTRNKHLILHTKQYPYKCEQCNKGFTTRTKVANHLAKVHNDDSMLTAGRKVCEYKMALRPSEMADVESLHEFHGDDIEESAL